MSGVGEWLASLGLPQFGEVFDDNGIDFAILPDLTDDDLRSLGVHRLVDRKRVLTAAAQLKEQGRASGVHRRIVSALFCDLVDSTSLARRLDPEELRTAFRSYMEAVVKVITSHGGQVANLMGDGVLACFGWPEADEDQAGQAVRAGLAAVAAVHELRFDDGRAPHCRVGIATGPVVIGGGTDVDSAFGEVLHLAARLQSVALADTVIIDATTHRGIGRAFDVRPRSIEALKGFADPVASWEVLGERRHVSRLAARNVRTADFVGRDAELGILAGIWDSVRSGVGHVVVVCGEPGVGKSRLVEEFCRARSAESALIVSYQCSSHHTNSAFYPVTEALERVAGINPVEDASPTKRRKLEAVFGAMDTEELAELPILADLLGISQRTGDAHVELSPQERRERTISFLVQAAVRLSRERPVCILVEDIHWMDPSTRELLDALGVGTVSANVLTMATTRPPLDAVEAWTHASTVMLAPLADGEIEAIVRVVDASSSLSSGDVQGIVSKAEGIPLFAEELTLSELERRATSGGSSRLPETIEASLTARLDSHREGKVVAQIGAILGRQFRVSDATALAGDLLTRSEFELGLQQLTRAGLVLEVDGVEERQVRFKHALVQDVAYGSLLRETRHQLHRRVALEVLPDVVRVRRPEIVAHHLTEAGLTRDAIVCWRDAGEHAAAKSANAESIAHYTRGLDLVHRLTDDPTRDALAFSLHVGLSAPVIARFGYTSAELARCLEDALSLSDRVPHTPAIYTLLYSRWGSLLVSGAIEESLRVALHFADLAERQRDHDALLARHRMLGGSYMCLGDLPTAFRELQALIDGYDASRHANLYTVYGVDLLVAGMGFQSEVMWLMGRPEQAQRSAELALDRADSVGHVNSRALALHFCTLMAFLRRDAAGTRRYADRMAELASGQPIGAWPFLVGAMAGWSMVDEGDIDGGLLVMRDGIAKATMAGVSMFVPFVACRLAEVLIERGQHAEADAVLSAEHERMTMTREVAYEGELLRLQARVRVHGGQPDVARDLLGRAVAVARSQGALSLELRAAMDDAETVSSGPGAEDAKAQLAATLDRWPEGDDSSDVRAARATLRRLMERVDERS